MDSVTLCYNAVGEIGMRLSDRDLAPYKHPFLVIFCHRMEHCTKRIIHSIHCFAPCKIDPPLFSFGCLKYLDGLLFNRNIAIK